MSFRAFYAADEPGWVTERSVFFAVSILRLVLLSLCSFQLYQVYWIYKKESASPGACSSPIATAISYSSACAITIILRSS